MRDFAFRISREKIFFNFPSLMREEIFFEGISFFTCEKRRDFFEFPFSHEKKSRKNEFLFTKMSKISDFCEKKRDFLFTFHCEKRFFSISLPPWGKGNFLGGFLFPHVGREEIVFPFPFSTVTLLNCINVFDEIDANKLSKHRFHDHVIETKNKIFSFEFIYNLFIIKFEIFKKYLNDN